MPAPVAAVALRALASLAGGRCLICRAWCREPMCSACDAAFASPSIRCVSCALRLDASPFAARLARCAGCVAAPPPWVGAVAAVDYASPWDTLVGAFKFQSRVDLAGALATLLARATDPAQGSASPAPLPRADLVLPVPLAPARLRERGYNQAWELARRVARLHGTRAFADALFRVRDTPHQLALSRAARASNLHDAFAVSPRHAARVRGARIALVDDVLTTGATAGAAVRALRAAGAADVRLWVLARTPGSAHA